MSYEVIGRTALDYTKDGKEVKGCKLHLAYDDANTVGICPLSIYISAKNADVYEIAQALAIGDRVTPLYTLNQYNRPVLNSIEVV